MLPTAPDRSVQSITGGVRQRDHVCSLDDSAGLGNNHSQPMIIAHADASVKQERIGIGFELYQPSTSTAPGEDDINYTANVAINGEQEPERITSEIAEYKAVVEAAKAAALREEGFLVLASDCKNVVEKIRRSEPVTEDNRLLQELHETLDNFESWRVKHVSRDYNTVAHKQARQAMMAATF